MIKRTKYFIVVKNFSIIGAILTVVTKQWFKSTITKKYECFGFEPFNGAKWKDCETGKVVEPILSMHLSDQAQKLTHDYI